jgi:hypothetical protein
MMYSRRLELRSLIVLAAAGIALACAGRSAARSGAPAPSRVAGAQLFDFHSNSWVNLHHFLYVSARARRGLDRDRTAVTTANGDTLGFGALPAEQRAIWDRSLDYYAAHLADRDILFDSAMVGVTNQLSDLGEGGHARDTHLDPQLAATLDAASQVYRALWWPRLDAANRAWIARVKELLAAHGDSAAAWEARVFDTRWSSTPVRVDVCAYTNWAGAYTTESPSRINVSTVADPTGREASFETLFHEVLHTMDTPLFDRLTNAARAQGKKLPRDPTHAFIFYTAGEVARAFFPGHQPFAESGGIWARSRDLGAMRPLLVRDWQPWIAGRSSFDDAIRQIVGGL